MIKIGKNISGFSTHSCQPETKKELEDIIEERVSKDGVNCNLNDIDTSLITDMSFLFYEFKFNGEISNWNVSKVKNMEGMFYRSKFNKDISKWDVNKVTNMSYMFYNSSFNGNISRWDLEKAKNLQSMFERSKFNGDISRWMIDKTRCNIFLIFSRSSIKEEHKPNSLR